MSRLAFGSAARINLRELLRRAIKLPMKKLGHAIEDWVKPIANGKQLSHRRENVRVG
jgi:hypothetical protein